MKKFLTKYVVGANANPPKNPKSPPKKGKQIPMNIVNAVVKGNKTLQLNCMHQKE